MAIEKSQSDIQICELLITEVTEFISMKKMTPSDSLSEKREGPRTKP